MQATPFSESQLGDLLRSAQYDEHHPEAHVYDALAVTDAVRDQVVLQPQPSASEPAPKKRKSRQTLPRGGACEFCKRRKLKCDGELPSCRACVKGKVDCVYSQVKQRSRVRVLEDKLAELEARISGEAQPTAAETNSAIENATAALHIPTTSNPSPYATQYPPHLHADMVSTIPIDPELQDADFEPDLMTLANAAEAAGSHAKAKRARTKGAKWDGVPVEILLAEVLKAVDGGPLDSIGQAIIIHAIELHAAEGPESFQHRILPMRSFLPRFSRDAPQNLRPHPALLLSLLFNKLPDSPSPPLKALAPLLYIPAQNAQSIGIANCDRMIDIVRGSALRVRRVISDGKYFQGWAECGNTSRLAQCAGLSNISIGDILYVLNRAGRLPSSPPANYQQERQVIAFKDKLSIAPVARTELELKERIDLFWCVWMSDKLNQVCWGWTSAFNEEHITTPFPRPHDEPLSITPTGTLMDVMRGQPRPPGAPEDTYLVAALKVLVILQKSSLTYELAVCQEATDTNRRLLMALDAIESSLPADFLDLAVVPRDATPEAVSKVRAQKIALHSLLKTTSAFIHFKLDIDSPNAFYRNKALDAINEFTVGMDAIVESDYRHFDVLLGAAWFAVGRAASRYARYLDGRPDTTQAVIVLRQVVWRLIDVFKIMREYNHAAAPVVHLLENSLAGDDSMVGLFSRPDSTGQIQ